VAALGSWFWGLIVTGAFLLAMGRLRGAAARGPIWVGLTVATLAVWLVATIAGIASRWSRPGRTPPAGAWSPASRCRRPPRPPALSRAARKMR